MATSVSFLLLILTVFVAYQIAFHYFGLTRIKKEVRLGEKPDFPVSVIICAKNESAALTRNLPAICQQDYDDYEVLVMDDHSKDDTASVLLSLCERFPVLRYEKVSEVNKSVPGKKAALKEAIEAASHKVLLLTDADCRPASPHWLTAMTRPFKAENIDAVLGIGRYEESRGLLNSIIQFETLSTANSYLGFASLGRPYMGVGRNVAYRKSIVKGEVRGEDLASGDDDLFLMDRLNEGNTAVSVLPEAHTISDPPNTWKAWLNQKRRHYSTALRYRSDVMARLFWHKVALYVPYLVIFWIFMSSVRFGVISLVTYWLIRALLWNSAGRFLGFPRRIYFLPCYDVFFAFFDLWTTLLKPGKKNQRWT